MYCLQEVADMLRLHPKTVAVKVRSGEIHGVKFGRDWRVSREEVDRLMTEGLK